MRIAIGGVATECSTFSPIVTTLEHFRVREGEAMLDDADYPFLGDTDAELFPTVQARAIPGGRVARATYDELKERFLNRLAAALPLDGLYLDMHGAMNVEGMDDAEGDWYAAAREVVGPNCVMSASYDLHGNLSPRILETLDLLTAFRTAPHVDYLETRVRAFRLLERSLREGVRPAKVWVSIPTLLPGERTSTEYEPAQSLYARLPEVDAQPGVWDSSLLVGYAWADEPRSSSSVVLLGTDTEVLKREAEKLSLAYWEQREQFTFAVPSGSLGEAITWALAHPERSLILSDAGDNPTAGGVGDRADFLRALLENNVQDAVVGGLCDPAATAECSAAGVGARVSLTVGGALAESEPMDIAGEVLFLDDTPDERERQAVVQVAGVTLILSAKRRPYHHEADFLQLGVRPQEKKLTVVKVGYLVPDLKRMARATFLALSPGAVNQDIARLPFQRVPRPVYPLEPHMTWGPEALRF